MQQAAHITTTLVEKFLITLLKLLDHLWRKHLLAGCVISCRFESEAYIDRIKIALAARYWESWNSLYIWFFSKYIQVVDRILCHFLQYGDLVKVGIYSVNHIQSHCISWMLSAWVFLLPYIWLRSLQRGDYHVNVWCLKYSVCCCVHLADICKEETDCPLRYIIISLHKINTVTMHYVDFQEKRSILFSET